MDTADNSANCGESFVQPPIGTLCHSVSLSIINVTYKFVNSFHKIPLYSIKKSKNTNNTFLTILPQNSHIVLLNSLGEMFKKNILKMEHRFAAILRGCWDWMVWNLKSDQKEFSRCARIRTTHYICMMVKTAGFRQIENTI